jgi:predicted nucleic-acid-binding protein
MLNDHPMMSEAVRERLARESFLIKPEVLAEVIYVLGKVYKLSKEEVANSISELLNTANVYMEFEDIVRCAVKTYKSYSLDFVDCMLYAYETVNREKIFTFDKSLLKILGKLK